MLHPVHCCISLWVAIPKCKPSGECTAQTLQLESKFQDVILTCVVASPEIVTILFQDSVSKKLSYHIQLHASQVQGHNNKLISSNHWLVRLSAVQPC